VRELAQYLDTTPETILADSTRCCSAARRVPAERLIAWCSKATHHLSFAEHFKRPVNLTFEEALSLNLALRTLR